MKATVLQTEMLFSDFLLLFILIGGGGGGEGGEFCEPQEFFFPYQIPCMNLF